MNRRDFLKGAGGLSLAAGAVVLSPRIPVGAASVQADGVLTRFRGSSDGRIYELSANGSTWQPRANFGQHCAITEVFERGGRVYARVVVQGNAFTLQSSDGRKWRNLAGGSSRV